MDTAILKKVGLRMLTPRGGRVELRAPGAGRAGEHRLMTAAGDLRCYSTFSQVAAGVPGLEELLAELRDPGDWAAVAYDLDDAARRVSPSNGRAIDRLERAVELLGRALDRVPEPVLVLPAADRVDAPSLRLLAVAWSRRPYRPGGRLVLEVVGGWPMAEFDEPWEVARCAALNGVVLGLRAVMPMAIEGTAQPDVTGQEGDFEDAVHAFHRRNYEQSARLACDGPDGLLLKALVAARCGRTSLAVRYLEVMEVTALSSNDRARACSTRSVVQAKLGGEAGLADALACVHRGIEHVGSATSVEARGQRGWLFNNAGLVEVMQFLKDRDVAAIERAGDWLRNAMGEVARIPSEAFPALHYNIRANAVQWLEMRGRFAEAIDWLDRAFGDVVHPSYHYRRAVLSVKVNRPTEALRSLDVATDVCTPREWPYREHVERARGHLLFGLGQHAKAEAAFVRGLELCLQARSATGLAHHAAGLAACWNRTGRGGETRHLADRLLAEGAPALELGTSEPPRPPGKLPPFIPEIDMHWASRPGINHLISRVSEKPS